MTMTRVGDGDTWWDVHGGGEPLVLLHPGGAASRAFDAEPVHLLGHSVGAPVGLLVAQRRPDLVQSLVLSEGVFHFDGWREGVLDPLPADVLADQGEVRPELCTPCTTRYPTRNWRSFPAPNMDCSPTSPASATS